MSNIIKFIFSPIDYNNKMQFKKYSIKIKLFFLWHSKLRLATLSTLNFSFQNFLWVGSFFNTASLTDEHIFEESILCLWNFCCHSIFRENGFLKLFYSKRGNLGLLPLLKIFDISFFELHFKRGIFPNG